MSIPPEIGRKYWAELHSWSDRFRAEVQASGSDCGCGEFAQKAARALHDFTNFGLGKEVQDPENLKWIAKGFSEVASVLPSANGDNGGISGDSGANGVHTHQYSRGRCMDCSLPPTWECLWAEGMAHAWFCDRHAEEFRKREMWHGVSQISAERPLRYGVASRRYRDGPPTKAEADKYLASMRQEFLQGVMEQSALFGWPGGKSKLKARIIALIPPHKTYVEPFAGAASVFWAKEPSQVEALQKAAGRLGSLARQVYTTQPGVLVYQVNLPKQEEESLVFKPMFPGSERAGLLPRQTEPAEQAPLFVLQRMAEQEQRRWAALMQMIVREDQCVGRAGAHRLIKRGRVWVDQRDYADGRGWIDFDVMGQVREAKAIATYERTLLTTGCLDHRRLATQASIYPWPEHWFEDEEDDDEGGLEKKEKKHKKPTTSQEQGVYVSWALSPDSEARMRRFITQDLRLPEPTWPLHITTVHSKRPFDYTPAPRPLPTEDLELRVMGYGLLTGPNSERPSLVLYVDAPALQDSHSRAIKAGASWDFPEFAPHITLAYGGTLPAKVDLLMKPAFTFTLSPSEKVEPLKENWRPPILSQSFLQSVLAAAVSGGSATFGAMLVSKFLEKRKEEEEHPGRRLVGIVDDSRKDNNKEGGRPGSPAAPGFTPVAGVAIVEGDMIQADLGPLLQDLDKIIQRGEMGEVSTKTLRVTRE